MIRRYPLVSFFVLAFVFSWWPWPLDLLGLAPSPHRVRPVFTPMFSGTDRARQGWLIAAVWCVAAVTIAAAGGSVHLARTYRRQTFTVPQEAPRAVASGPSSRSWR